MKKILVGSTALIAAGLLSAPAIAAGVEGGANLDLSLGGDMSFKLEYMSKQPTKADTDAQRSHNFELNGEMHVMGTGGNDAGLTFGFEFELETAGVAAGGDTIDQNWIWVDGQFGKVTLGGTAMSALDAAGDTATYSGVGLLAADANDNEAASTGDGISGHGENNKLIWLPPAMGNLSFAVNYVPDINATDTTGTTSSDDAGEGDRAFLVAGKYSSSFGGADLILEVSMYSANSEDPNTAGDTDVDDDRRSRIGAEVTIDDLSFGGFYREYQDTPLTTAPSEDRQVIGAFVQYTGVNDDTTIGLSWAKAEAEELTAGTPNTKDGEDKQTKWNIGVTIANFGAADRTLKLGYQSQKWEDDANAAGNENDATSIDIKYEWDVASGLEFDLGYQNFRYTHHDGLSTAAKRTGHAFVATTKVSF
jgi:hypothetical protein